MADSANKRLITVSYEISDPEGNVIEQGFENETGQSFDNILEAATWLTDEGAVYPSASDAKGPLWFHSEDYVDHKTGQSTRRAFHPKGFTQTERDSLFYAVQSAQNLGNPMILSKAMVDEFEEYARTFTVNEDGIVTSASDKNIVGYHQAVAYIEKFAGQIVSDEFKTSLAREADIAPEDFFPGQTFIALEPRDAIYFGLTERPILISTITADNTISHQFMSRAEIKAQAEEMKSDDVNRKFGR